MKAHLVRKIGFGPDDKLLIINSDDFGMCHSANVGTISMLTEGFGTTASIIVPAPWALEAMRWYRTNSQQSIGIEIALTSEWEHYRWGPVSPREKVPSLVDTEGYFWGSVELVNKHVRVEDAEIEVRTQIERFNEFCPPPTHMLNHMGSLLARPDLRAMFIRLLKEYRLPSRLPELQDRYDWPSIDKQVGFDLYYASMDDAKETRFYEILNALGPGLYEFYPHTAVDSAELRAICAYSKWIPQDPNSWVGRVSDLALYTLPRVRRWLDEHGWKLITWRHLRDAIAKEPGSLPKAVQDAVLQ